MTFTWSLTLEIKSSLGSEISMVSLECEDDVVENTSSLVVAAASRLPCCDGGEGVWLLESASAPAQGTVSAISLWSSFPIFSSSSVVELENN